MVVDVTSREGIDKGPGRPGWGFDGSRADDACILLPVDRVDVCSPGAPTGGPEPVVVGKVTLVMEAVPEALGYGAVIVGAFASLEVEGPCMPAPFAGWC